MHPFDVFEAASEAPNHAALVHSQGTLSYAALAELAERALGWLSHRLAATDEWPASPVAVVAAPRVEQVAMTHALISRHIPVVPLHPKLAAGERADLVRRSGAPLLVDEGWANESVSARSQSRALEIRRARDDAESPLAMVQTSGSSGTPRLAVLSHRAFRASSEAHTVHLGWRAGDRWLLGLPFAHIGGFSILTRCLAARSTVVLAGDTPPSGRVRSSNTDLLRNVLERESVTLLSLVPTQLERLLADPGWHCPQSLRAVLVGGAAATDSTLAAARVRGVPVLATYGMTETCSQICTQALATHTTAGGVGRPLQGVELEIDEGEILVRGPMLFSGYLGEERTRTQVDWFRTGDLGSIDAQGYVQIAGRRDDLIITGGENVHPSEVETALDGIMPSRRFCVFGRDDEVWGQQVTLAIEGVVDHTLVQRIADFAEKHLATFKRPRAVMFFDELPELGSGKISRRALNGASQKSVVPIRYAKASEGSITR